MFSVRLSQCQPIKSTTQPVVSALLCSALLRRRKINLKQTRSLAAAADDDGQDQRAATEAFKTIQEKQNGSIRHDPKGLSHQKEVKKGVCWNWNMKEVVISHRWLDWQVGWLSCVARREKEFIGSKSDAAGRSRFKVTRPGASSVRSFVCTSSSLYVSASSLDSSNRRSSWIDQGGRRPKRKVKVEKINSYLPRHLTRPRTRGRRTMFQSLLFTKTKHKSPTIPRWRHIE